MHKVGNVIETIQERIQHIRKKGTTVNSGSEEEYECRKCKDTGYIVNGWIAKECSCLERKRLVRRMKNAMIPDEFKNARFDSFRVDNDKQRKMLNEIKRYLSRFEDIKDTSTNSFGFIAVFGEKRLKEMRDPQKRAEMKKRHNNFGVGKTHLQIAAAKVLIKRGYNVLCVSDVTFMEDLGQSQYLKDEGEQFDNLLSVISSADVVVWDDIGKARTNETRKDWYYRIINNRYRERKPIIYSSNEDKETLSEKIGDAAASRLFGMSQGEDGMDFLFEVEGPDYRLTGGDNHVRNVQ